MERAKVFLVLFLCLLCSVFTLGVEEQPVDSEDLLSLAREGRLHQVTAQRLTLSGTFQAADSQQMQNFQVEVKNGEEMRSVALQLDRMGVPVEIRPDDEGFILWVLVGVAALGALVGGLWFAFFH